MTKHDFQIFFDQSHSATLEEKTLDYYLLFLLELLLAFYVNSLMQTVEKAFK